jgi:hypothetical protein
MNINNKTIRKKTQFYLTISKLSTYYYNNNYIKKTIFNKLSSLLKLSTSVVELIIFFLKEYGKTKALEEFPERKQSVGT